MVLRNTSTIAATYTSKGSTAQAAIKELMFKTQPAAQMLKGSYASSNKHADCSVIL